LSFSVDTNVPESIKPLRFSIRFTEETLSLETQQASKFVVYPNPVTNNKFSIFGLAEGEKANIKIVSMSGKVVFTATQITEMETSIVLKKGECKLNSVRFFRSGGASPSRTKFQI